MTRDDGSPADAVAANTPWPARAEPEQRRDEVRHVTLPPARRTDVPLWLDRQAAIAGRLLLIGLALAAVVWLALQVQFIAMAVVLGFAEVSLLWPAVRWLRDRRVPQPIAAILCVVAFIAVFVTLLVFVVGEVIRSSPEIAESVRGAVDNILDWLRSGPFGIESAAIQDALAELQNSIGDFIGGVGIGLAAGLSVVGNLLTVLLIATFFAIFALSSGDTLWASFVRLLRPDHHRAATAAFKASMQAAGNWFYAATLTGMIDGLLIGTGLVLLDVPLAVPIGALTFVLAYVPLVGALIAGAVAVLVAVFAGGWVTGLWTFLLVLGVQQLEGNVLAPLLLSRALSFHPLVMLVLTTTAAAAFGLVGLFLAIPVTGAVVAAVIAFRRETGAATPATPIAAPP
ncbi:MAG: AI-2E family transporter [Jiangellaceae bacterium]|nr:AI-2E family transporter [Jiangellaceae bacterium]